MSAVGRIVQEIVVKVTGTDDAKAAEKVVKELDGKKAKVTVDVDADQAKTGLAGLKQSIGDADGLFGKIKAGAGGLKTAFSDLGPAATAGLAAGGITAIGAAVGGALTAVDDLGLKVGELADKTGLSTQEASRWVEVADDMKLSADDIAGVLGKMNKNLDPKKWEEYGIAIAHAKDGTVDVDQTFLNAIDHLHGIADATDRAKEGQALFGKGWATVSELVSSGADVIKGKLDDVADVKILTPEDVKQARDFRDAMHDLSDVGEELVLTLGKALLPAVTKAAVAAKAGAPAVQKFGDALGAALGGTTTLLTNNLETLGKGATAAGHAFGDLWDNSVGYKGAVVDLSGQVDHLGIVVRNNTGKSLEARDAADVLAESQKKQADAAAAAVVATSQLEDRQQALNGATDAAAAASEKYGESLGKQADAMFGLGGADVAAQKAEETFGTAAAATAEAIKKHGENSKEAKEATEHETDAAIAAAKAQEALADQHAKAAGKTQSNVDKIDSMNAALLNQAHLATPAARDAIADYITQANDVPPDKVTDIKAAIAAGDFDTAKRLLDEASATRNVAIVADAHTTQAESDIQQLIKTRNLVIEAQIVAKGGAGFGPIHGTFSEGGVVGAGGGVAGEAGVEVVTSPHGRAELVSGPTAVPQGTVVTSTNETARILAALANPAKPTIVNNTVNVYVPQGYRERGAVEAAYRSQIRSGRLYASL